MANSTRTSLHPALFSGSTTTQSQLLRHALLNGRRDLVEQILEWATWAGVQISISLESIYDVVDGIPAETIDRLKMEVDGEDVMRQMPLYVLLYAGKFDAVQLILQYAGRFNLTVSSHDEKHKRTCLHWAILHQQLEIVKKLVSLHLDSSTNYHPRILQVLTLNPTTEDHYGKTIVQIAFQIGNQEVLDALYRNPSFKGFVDRLYTNKRFYIQSNLVVAIAICGFSFSAMLQVPAALTAPDELRLALWIFLASSIIAFYTSMFVICKSIVQTIQMAHMYSFSVSQGQTTTITLIVSSIFLGITFVATWIPIFITLA